MVANTGSDRPNLRTLSERDSGFPTIGTPIPAPICGQNGTRCLRIGTRVRLKPSGSNSNLIPEQSDRLMDKALALDPSQSDHLAGLLTDACHWGS